MGDKNTGMKVFKKIVMFLIFSLMLVATLKSVISADETYFEENASIFDSVSVGTITGRCGEWVDWDDDGFLDLVGFRNDTGATPNILWQIMINNGSSNIAPDFEVIYNFTVTTRGDRDDGGECVAVVDLDGDGIKDILTYEELVPDSSVALGNGVNDDVSNKTGYRGFWLNKGTHAEPDFQLNNSMIAAPITDGSVHNPMGSDPSLYNYMPGGLIGSFWVLDDLCHTDCGGDICESGVCFGQNTYAPNPRVYYQFYDFDLDNDYDLMFWSEPMEWGAWENVGTAISPSWVQSDDFISERNGTGYFDNIRFGDFNSDGNPDIIGTPESPVLASLRAYTSTGRWADIQSFNYIQSWDYNLTAPFDDSNTYEPLLSGTKAMLSYTGDADGDGDIDLLFSTTTPTGSDYVFYRSKGWGDASGYVPLTEGCDWPCQVDDDFDDVPDGASIGDYPGWTAPDCVTVENGELVINGSCTTGRVCRDTTQKLTKVATVQYNITIPALAAGKFSVYYDLFIELSLIHGWEPYQFYHYLGSFLPKENLTTWDTNKNDYEVVLNYSNKDYVVTHEGYDGTLDFYDGSSDPRGLGSVCWNVINTSSVMYIDDLKIYAGTDITIDTTNTLITSDGEECYGILCYDTSSILGDQRPSNYESQRFETAYVNWELCIEAGVKPNWLCPFKLYWADLTDSIKNWFIDNIVIIMILLLLAIMAALLVVRRSRD